MFRYIFDPFGLHAGQGGAVGSVNGKTGDVKLEASDVNAYTKEEMDEIIGPVDEALDELIEALVVFVGSEE